MQKYDSYGRIINEEELLYHMAASMLRCLTMCECEVDDVTAVSSQVLLMLAPELPPLKVLPLADKGKGKGKS
jgi:hypothetical protein